MTMIVRDALGANQTVETLPPKGQAIAANSLPVTIANDQTALPISPAYPASGKSAVTGTFSATGQSSPFTPLPGRGFNVSLWGTFAGSIPLERSFDSGTTWLRLTAAGQQIFAFTAPVSEQMQEDELGVQYRLNCTALTSGAVNYRISQ